jgi:saccharopine dehydrogenase-like NADP-dependent oxidoreductase
LEMKSIVLFGAGKSATFLIDYLTNVCTQKNWNLFIGDSNAETLQKKLKPSSSIHPVQVDVKNSSERTVLVRKADLVISLLPPALHILVARDCLLNGKNLLTASYADKEINELSSQIREKNLFFLYEMGLDPGIDHMSAMQLIHRIHEAGGKIIEFRSHTGGLVAPENDNNPWHYKISWNPANVVRAGSAGAIFKKSGLIKETTYENIFRNPGLVNIRSAGQFAWYPNRDSIAYMPVYGLESADSFIRTTLRHPDFCFGWQNLVSAGLTDDILPVPDTIKTISDWSKPLLPYVNVANKYLYDQLGLFENEPLPINRQTSAKVLQALLEKKWQMNDSDRDMILMLHEFVYEWKNESHNLRSSLMVKGENSFRTAMAKTVGLPLGIAAKLILENKIQVKGLHIPIIPEIYEPVLQELSLHGIRFEEETT